MYPDTKEGHVYDTNWPQGRPPCVMIKIGELALETKSDTVVRLMSCLAGAGIGATEHQAAGFGSINDK